MANPLNGQASAAAVEWLREKSKIGDEAKAAGESSMRCPRCNASLAVTKFEDVSVDRCDNCGGLWLDAGELAQLIQKDSDGWFRRLGSKTE
ncbi:MAG TPA: zf-TFIIB domain-containing protein [Pyrinomonadaceae bacterium]